jgi:hypothetical protein
MYKYGEKRHWPYAVAAVTLLVLFVSAEKQSRLIEKPPPQFLALDIKGEKDDPETALGYWECARRVIQYKYHYGAGLPVEPPPEFALPDRGPASSLPERKQRVRAKYWENLRKVWLLPDAWDESYTLQFSWFERGLDRLKTMVRPPKIVSAPAPERLGQRV